MFFTPSKWSFFEATGILKDISDLNHSKYKLWWYKNDEKKYKRIVNDNDVEEVYKYAIKMKCLVHLYVDHSIKGIVSPDPNPEKHEHGDGNNFEEDKQGDEINVEEDEQGDGFNVEEDEQGDGINVEKDEQGDRINVEEDKQGDGTNV